MQVHPSPIVSLNRALAIATVNDWDHLRGLMMTTSLMNDAGETFDR
jgi:predicted RNA polymerase sigma factor